MKRYLWWVLTIVLVLGLAVGLFSLANRRVVLHIDGETRTVQGWIWTCADVLRQAGVVLHEGDRVQPQLVARLPGEVTVLRTTPGVVVDGDQAIPFWTLDRQPVSIMRALQVSLAEGDQILLNGVPVALDQALPLEDGYIFQVQRSKKINLIEDGQRRQIRTFALSVSAALWEAGVRLSPEDQISVLLSTPVTDDMEVALRRAKDINITTAGQMVTVHTAATTIGEVLAEGGLSLQGLDYSLPAESESLPATGQVRIVKVREEVILDQKLLPYDKEVRSDEEGELDSWRVVDPGQAGILVTRSRVRYEDGVEVARQVEDEWQAQASRNQVLGYGTKVVVKTEEVNGETIEYWRKITVYATSYSPCNSGGGRCYPNTASGLPVQRGVVGVIRSWYNMMAGQPVYIPGYGRAVIADIGAGVAGVNWIDLGFSDSDYIPYYWNVTLYFLTPVPGYIPALLP